MWCVRCYHPVRQLTPREVSSAPVVHFLDPPDRPRSSRWRKGATTFGPVGRLVLTAFVLALAPWGGLAGFSTASSPLTLWWLLGWAVFASVVLRSVWRREAPIDGSPGALDRARARMEARHPTIGRSFRIPPIVVLGAIGVVVLAGLAIGWVHADASGRYTLVAIGAAAGVGLFLAAWNDV
jgi:hypothetical protein